LATGKVENVMNSVNPIVFILGAKVRFIIITRVEKTGILVFGQRKKLYKKKTGLQNVIVGKTENNEKKLTKSINEKRK